jgi:thioredoxin-dependent peroxiredoxin
MLHQGEAAPDFELPSDSGERVRLSSLRGRPVVLYFYPRSDTPGCTRQACAIRDVWDEFARRDAVVLGVSTDREGAQARFKEKYGLPFTILADPERTLGDTYGVAQEGKASYSRSTYVIDRDGTIAKIMKRVDPGTHADRVLAALPS